VDWSQRRRISESLGDYWQKKSADKANAALLTFLIVAFVALVVLAFLAVHPGLVIVYSIKALFWKSLVGDHFWIAVAVACGLVYVLVAVAVRELGPALVVYFMLGGFLVFVELVLHLFFKPVFLREFYLTAFPEAFSQNEVAVFQERQAAPESLPLSSGEVKNLVEQHLSGQRKSPSSPFTSVAVLGVGGRSIKCATIPAKKKGMDATVQCSPASYWPLAVEVSYPSATGKKAAVPVSEKLILYLGRRFSDQSKPDWGVRQPRELVGAGLPVDEAVALASTYQVDVGKLGSRPSVSVK
jgi:hypothetical protein